MMQLILTVMGIGLAALLAVGGINYFSPDIGLRVEVAQALRTQYDAITSAAVSYRTANNGFVPRSVDSLKGFLPNGKVPEFPRGLQPFEWTIDKPINGDVRGLCLTRTSQDVAKGALEGVISFASERAARHPGSVRFGVAGVSDSNPCKIVGGGTVVSDENKLDTSYFSTNAGATISFQGF